MSLNTISQIEDVDQLDALSDKILMVESFSGLQHYIQSMPSKGSWTH